MTFDYYASLHGPNLDPKASTASDLASGFVDKCLVWSNKGDRDQQKARNKYQKQAAGIASLDLPEFLRLEADWTPTIPRWFSLSIEFELQTPWYSKDDRPFHVLDNPVRKDRVFGVPFMSAASWKGLLRWACRMEAGLLKHLEQHENKLDGWREPGWIVHLFGNEKEEREHFNRGALAFRPTWFDKVGFEVINPHDRSRRAGTKPLVYEVVPGRRLVKNGSNEQEIPGATGTFHLLYAPLPGAGAPADTFQHLFAAIEALLTVYGFSAKRTAGWGMAAIQSWQLAGAGGKTNGNLKTAQHALAQLDRVRFRGAIRDS